MNREWMTAPMVRVNVAGRPFSQKSMEALESVAVQGRLGLPTQCELLLDGDRLGELSPGDWSLGASVRIWVSGREGESLLFEGELAGIEQSYPPAGAKEVRMRAYDSLFRLYSRQSVRGLRQVTIAELAQELVSDLGLTVKKKVPGPSRRWIMQHRQTDLQLLREQAESAGLYASVRGRYLHLLTLEGSGEHLELEQGANLLESRFDVGGASAGGGVTGYGWDPATGATAERKASRPRSGRKTPWSRQGPQASEFSLLDLGLEEPGQVASAAQGTLDRAASRELTFWGVANGDARLQPGSRVDVRGVDRALEGRFVLTSVRHRLDRAHGFISEVSSFPPRPTSPSTATAVVPGEVTSVKDPDKQGRVKVTLPTFAGLETGWMRIVSPGLGRNRGFVAVPDVGDQVAVAIGHGDPARGLVLGGIFDGRGSMDSGVEGGRVRRFQFRAGEQLVVLDEEKGSIRLENKEGSRLELTPEGIRLHSVGHLILEAPGKKVRLGASRIDMEKA